MHARTHVQDLFSPRVPLHRHSVLLIRYTAREKTRPGRRLVEKALMHQSNRWDQSDLWSSCCWAVYFNVLVTFPLYPCCFMWCIWYSNECRKFFLYFQGRHQVIPCSALLCRCTWCEKINSEKLLVSERTSPNHRTHKHTWTYSGIMHVVTGATKAGQWPHPQKGLSSCDSIYQNLLLLCVIL